MKAWQICSALTLGVGVLAGSAFIEVPARAGGVPAEGGSRPTWLPSYEAACAAARQSEKPIFLVFR
jgi:hypothetical protein